MRALFLLTCMCVLGCSQSIQWQHMRPIQHSYDQFPKEMIYDDGRPVCISYGEVSTIAVSAIRTEKRELLVNLMFANVSDDTRFDVLPDNIRVTGTGNKKQYTFKVFNAEEYLQRLRNKQSSSLMFSAIFSALSNSSAGYSKSKTSGVVGNTGSGVRYSETTTTYDHSKALEASERSRERLHGIAKEYARSNEALSSKLIRRNTVFPGEAVDGALIVEWKEIPRGQYFIEIPLGDEVHVIVLVLDSKY